MKKMGLQRNYTTEECKKIVRQVRDRKDRLGKESKHVRVMGHMLSEAKIARWWKEQTLAKSLATAKSPSRSLSLSFTSRNQWTDVYSIA